MRIFQNKKTTFVVIIAAVLLLVLLCWLITLQVQRASFQAKVTELKQLIDDGEFQIEKYKTESEYRKSWDYIILKAKELGMLSPEQLYWIETNLGN